MVSVWVSRCKPNKEKQKSKLSKKKYNWAVHGLSWQTGPPGLGLFFQEQHPESRCRVGSWISMATTACRAWTLLLLGLLLLGRLLPTWEGLLREPCHSAPSTSKLSVGTGAQDWQSPGDPSLPHLQGKNNWYVELLLYEVGSVHKARDSPDIERGFIKSLLCDLT